MDLHMLSLDTIVPESLLCVKQDMRFPEFGDMWLFSVIYSHLIPCTHKDTQLTLGLIRWHQCLIQPKNDNSCCFGAQKVWYPNSTSLASLYWQKQLKTKILIKNGMILILKFVFTKCCTVPIKIFQSKGYLSRVNIKQNANDLSVCNIFRRLWCSGDLIHSHRCPNSNLALGPGHNYTKMY